MPEGERSEAVWRLELDMLRAGWADTEIVAVLAAQPWVRAMGDQHGPIIACLSADVARAREHMAQRDEAEERLAIPAKGCEVLRHEAVSEMRVGPSTALCRKSRQTTPSGWGTTALVVSVGEKTSREVRCGPRRWAMSEPM